MAFVPDYQHDIFVSYAHIDNELAPGQNEGWVTTLMRHLQLLLAQKLGKASVSLWMDHPLAADSHIASESLDSLYGSAVFLVVLSPGYLASAWCRQELEIICNADKLQGHSHSRVFVIERDEVGERPPGLRDLLGFRFWVRSESRSPRILGYPRPDITHDRLYYDRIYDLSFDLMAVLKWLKDRSEETGLAGPATVVAEPDAAPSVFLAEVTDDLDDYRDHVRRYLLQAGLTVIPEGWYPRDPVAFREAAQADLAQSRLFIQLLSEVAGKRSPDLPQGYVALQHELAVMLGTPILQWRSPDLRIDSLNISDHRALLEGATVVAMDLEEFKSLVMSQFRQLTSLPKTSADVRRDSLVFVNADETDISLAEAICEKLVMFGFGYSLPLRSGKPSEIRKDLEQNLLDCDALMLIYGHCSAAWVRQQLRYSRKVLYKRESPLRAITVYLGPPTSKEELDIALPNLRIIDGSRGLDVERLRGLADALASGEQS